MNSKCKIHITTVISLLLRGLFLVAICSVQGYAQLRLVPLPKTGNEKSPTELTIVRTKATPPLSLPFWDDFSNPLSPSNGRELFPDTARWVNPFSVWVGNGISANAPTINVATFDGINSVGRPYSPDDAQVSGFGDSLISKPIDLSPNATVNPVLPSYRDSVYLSFFYQWRGNGEAPDQNDYLQVDFLDNEGRWIEAQRISTTDDIRADTFQIVMIKVAGDAFFHERFQFMIRSFGNQSGPFDTWNIDYVYLNNYRHPNDFSFPDQAIVSPLNAFLPNQYRAMPYTHFRQSPSVRAPSFQIYNLRNSPEPLTYQVEATFTSFENEMESNQIVSTPENDLGFSSSILNGYQKGVVTVQGLPDPANGAPFTPTADSIFIDLRTRLFTGDNVTKFGQRADDYTYRYEPLDFRLNDTITTRYTLSNFYAYDDGFAEFAVELIESGNVVAYEFSLPADLEQQYTLLEYIDVYFPPFGVSSNLNTDFFIWGEQGISGKPGAVLLRIPSVRITSTGINAFQRLRFLPAIQIAQQKFYIGWRQPVDGSVYVGLDFSNDTGSKMFVNTAGGITPDPNAWTLNNTVTGSLMIRPVFGIGIADPTTGVVDEKRFSVYPNPSNGDFYIEGLVEDVLMTSLSGATVTINVSTTSDRTYVATHAQPGVYLLRYRRGVSIEYHKILIVRQ